VKALILQERWPAGRRLPSEDALAAQLGVSRTTLRKALDALEQTGWVRRERNRGCVVMRESEQTDPLASRTLLVVDDTPAIATLRHQDDGSAAGIQHGMVEAASALGYRVLFVNMDTIDAMTEDRLMSGVPAGVVMLCWQSERIEAQRLAAAFNERGVPIVAYGMDAWPDAVANYDRVVSDHESGMAQLLACLAAAGRRRILRLWTPPPETAWIAAHERAYARMAEGLGLLKSDPVHLASLPERVVDSRAVFDMRARVMAGYIAEQVRKKTAPDAIMVGTDCETFPVAAACRMLGINPGEDVLITGYDNYWHAAFERKFEPCLPFASVDKRNARIGAELVRLLSERILSETKGASRLSCVEQVCVPIHYRQMDVGSA